MNKKAKRFLRSLWPVTAVKDYTKSQNLGQTFNGEKKYFSKTEDGKSTGSGYGFEDLTCRRWKESGRNVKQVPPYKNGPDFIVDGEPCQLKCKKYSYSTAKSFYKGEKGKYSYGKQTAVVPKGQKHLADSFFDRENRKGNGKPQKVVESPVSRTEAENYTFKGVRSFLMDATDRQLVKSAATPGIIVLGIGTVDLARKWKKLDTKGKVKRTLMWLGIGVGTSALTLAGMCEYRQGFRPKRF